MIKFFKKSKQTYFRAILAFFAQTWAKLNFLEKKSPVSL